VETQTQTAGEIVLVPARFNERLIAYILDGAPLMTGYAVTVIYAGVPNRAAAIGWISAYVVYQFLGNLAGGTIGKKLMGLRVIARDGSTPGLIRSMVRALGHLVSTPLFNFGFVLALFHPENRALHDLLAGTVVVEPQRKQPAEAALLFVAAVMSLSALYGLIFYLNMFRAVPEDAVFIGKAKDGLAILAQIEEAFKKEHGRYTDSLPDLAQASGDAEQFRAAMSELFVRDGFVLEAGNRGYRISAKARDHLRTRVVIEGPPAKIVSP
jgi:uncharacterized RDD family membrane protein YckC